MRKIQALAAAAALLSIRAVPLREPNASEQVPRPGSRPPSRPSNGVVFSGGNVPGSVRRRLKREAMLAAAKDARHD